MPPYGTDSRDRSTCPLLTVQGCTGPGTVRGQHLLASLPIGAIVFPGEKSGNGEGFYEQFGDQVSRSAIGPTLLPVGVAWTPNPLSGPVHVIDGDGASLCEEIAPGDLVLIGNRPWHDIEPLRRCPICRFHLSDNEASG